MSFVGDFIGDVVGGITGAKQAGQAAEQAGQLQYQASMAGVEEQRRQFDKLVELMAPYVSAGEGAIGGLQPYRDVGQWRWFVPLNNSKFLFVLFWVEELFQILLRKHLPDAISKNHFGFRE